MGKIFPVNCFLARDTVVFSPSRRFHIAVMVFSFGHEGVVLGAEFTWTLVDFYIDNGSVAPNMESAPEWCRLLDDCFSGKVDLIITQKISNVTRKPQDLSFVSRLLAAQKKPVGIYLSARSSRNNFPTGRLETFAGRRRDLTTAWRRPCGMT